MLCQHCGQHEATRHYRTVINNHAQEAHLCNACAASTNFESDFQKSFPPFSLSFPAMMSDMLGLRTPQKSGRVCPYCNSHIDELAKSGQLGCVHCYEVFASELTPYVRRLYGDVTHTGRVPKGAQPALKRRREIEILEKRLQEAIHTQSFEEAAKLRDEIAQLREDGEQA